jgi:hypothetical protein
LAGPNLGNDAAMSDSIWMEFGRARSARGVEETGVHRWIPVAIRAILVCASILALFAMHGPSAAVGCHEMRPMAVSGGQPDSMETHDPATAMTDGARMGGGFGQLCVSRPPRFTAVGQLSLTLLMTIVGLAALAYWPSLRALPGRQRRRAPPAGKPLLHILCISRT